MEASTAMQNGPDGEDVVVEVDPEGRYHRYPELVGRGKFKACHKAFDSHHGIDVAWSKYTAASIHPHLSGEDGELARLGEDIKTNLYLEHPNIIKSFCCWEDDSGTCINLITELFTSGNLRQFRAHYPQLDMKAVKRMARQILRGLHYLHTLERPIAHGDLRCDKIYVNGNSGEIKIGDIGLATLVPYRWQGAERPCTVAELVPVLSVSTDVFAFGLCMLELLTLKQLDPQHCSEREALLAEVEDEEARAFVGKCLAEPPCLGGSRPTAEELLADPFLSVPRKVTMNGEAGGGSSNANMGSSTDLGATLGSTLNTLSKSALAAPLLHASSRSLQDVMANGGMNGMGTASTTRAADDLPDGDPSSGLEASADAPIAVGKLRGEDYEFEFGGQVCCACVYVCVFTRARVACRIRRTPRRAHGAPAACLPRLITPLSARPQVKDGKMNFRLVMTQASSSRAPTDEGDEPAFRRTIDFTFDPEVSELPCCVGESPACLGPAWALLEPCLGPCLAGGGQG
jgi:serine/threonine protein kinase